MIEPVRHARVAYTRVAIPEPDRTAWIEDLLASVADPGPTQTERALAILAPHLAREPLYEMARDAAPFARLHLNYPVHGQTTAPAPESQAPDLRKRATPEGGPGQGCGPMLTDMLANPYLVGVERR